MPTKFYKYQGTGNDFIMVDNRLGTFEKSNVEIRNLCHRRFGIGADGLILLENDEKYDFRMVYFNADGIEGSMCGNGGRCIVKFAYDLEVFKKSTKFIAVDGEHSAVVIDEDYVRLKMNNVLKIEAVEEGSFLNTGSPHLVIDIENDLNLLDVKSKGTLIRYSDFWKNRGGVNVNFTQYIENDTIFVRTYERGVEDETYSCGTGVTAAAIHSVVKNGMNSPITVKTLGGKLAVDFDLKDDIFQNIYLNGPAEFVFSGFFQ